MLAIEREAADSRATASRQPLGDEEAAPTYGVLAAVFRDETAAAEMLTELVDAGYDGTLVSGESQGTVLLELRLGPYENLEQAEAVAGTVRETFGLAPTVFVERPEE